MMNKSEFIELCLSAFRREAIKKLVFSRPTKSEITKVSGRVCAHRGQRILALEYTLPDNTVSQKNFAEESVYDAISELLTEYRQANLITLHGDAEWKRSKGGDKEVVLGGDALKKRLENGNAKFESAIEALDKKKNYILSGSEDFLITLGISDKNGRVHDKKQGKFRQINRFLEHIEDIYPKLPAIGRLNIYDLCCGKSYLSFAVYYYLTAIKGRDVYLLGIDLKREVIRWCDELARSLSYSGIQFVCDDVTNTPSDIVPDMVISLHACDIATDVVINSAIKLGAKIILSTPCCHRYLNNKVTASELEFVTQYPQLRGKLCEAMTDALRLARMRANGYNVSALELTDPENTPKNTLLRGVKEKVNESELALRQAQYEAMLSFVMGDKAEDYLKEIN